MKNLSIESKIEFFNFDNFFIYSTPENKNLIIDLVNNFHKKSNKYIGRNEIFIYNNLVIRKYFHGGLFRKVFNDSFFNLNRFLNEFKLHLYLNYYNFPTSKAVGILIKKKLFYKAYFITENIENCVDIISYLKNSKTEVSKEIFFKIGKVSNLLHEFNIIHNDLHLKNFLLKKGSIFLIDFDKSFFSNNKLEKLKDLKRFIRSCYKFNYLNKEKIKEKHIISFLEGYGTNKNLINEVNINILNKISWNLNKPK